MIKSYKIFAVFSVILSSCSSELSEDDYKDILFYNANLTNSVQVEWNAAKDKNKVDTANVFAARLLQTNDLTDENSRRELKILALQLRECMDDLPRVMNMPVKNMAAVCYTTIKM